MEEQTRIKICGLTRLEDIDAVNELKPEYVGFVFAKSRRQITKEHAVTLRRYPVSYTHLTMPTKLEV